MDADDLERLLDGAQSIHATMAEMEVVRNSMAPPSFYQVESACEFMFPKFSRMSQKSKDSKRIQCRKWWAAIAYSLHWEPLMKQADKALFFGSHHPDQPIQPPTQTP